MKAQASKNASRNTRIVGRMADFMVRNLQIAICSDPQRMRTNIEVRDPKRPIKVIRDGVERIMSMPVNADSNERERLNTGFPIGAGPVDFQPTLAFHQDDTAVSEPLPVKRDYINHQSGFRGRRNRKYRG